MHGESIVAIPEMKAKSISSVIYIIYIEAVLGNPRTARLSKVSLIL